MAQLSEIWIHPIKSIGGYTVPEARLERRGLQYDRRWMLVDEHRTFFSQRENPNMALLATRIEHGRLVVYAKKQPSDCIDLGVHPAWREMRTMRVSVWGAFCTARQYGDEINRWFSERLGQSLRLVYMPDVAKRATDGRYAPKGQYVSFADGFPYLLISQASLDDLNSRLAQPLPMNRFRPNFVCTGVGAYAEDSMADFNIGDWTFKGVKPCARCTITTIDQDNATQAAEPLKTLAAYRRSGNKVLFGQNVIWMDSPDRPAIIRVGDAIRKR
jgi:hypothetical protein